MNSRLLLGNKIRDFNFKTPWNGTAEFYDAVGNMPAVLIFMRYWGCPVCQMEMARIREEINYVTQKGGQVFVVLQSKPESISSLIKQEDFPFTIICDPQGKIFQLYGIEPGGIIKYLNPVNLLAAIKATIRGFRHGKFEGRETQNPATFVVAADRLIKYAHYGRNISDIPSLKEILNGI